MALALNECNKPCVAQQCWCLGWLTSQTSPGFAKARTEVIERLRALGANVDYNDPHVPHTRKMRQHDLKLASISLSPESLQKYDSLHHYEPERLRMVTDRRQRPAHCRYPQRLGRS